MSTVTLQLSTGRVTLPRSTPAEAWEMAASAMLAGHDMGGVWQGVHTVDGPVLVPASMVVEPLRVVE